MSDAATFYGERDRRTAQYLGGTAFVPAPVHISIGPAAASSPAGQLAAIALVNMVARTHRRMTVDLAVPAVDVCVASPFAGRLLGELLEGMATAIDPYLRFDLSTRAPEGALTVGIGPDARAGLEWYVGAERAVATLDHHPLELGAEPATLRGAALAACLASAALFRGQLGLSTAARRLSAWNYAEGADAELGPPDLPVTDIGHTLVVGAGAVGAGLVFWLGAFGVAGTWVVVDRDEVALHNTNRGMIFTAAHAAWGGGTPAAKAQLVAGLLPAGRPHACWYHECEAIRDEDFDVVLALANDYDVRTRLAHRNTNVLLHATTGENWLSQLHRHVLGVDDCLRCRTADVRTAALQCSSVPVVTAEGTSLGDAALPFLSAASGLMLATLLQRLAAGGETLLKDPHNDWRWDFASPHRMARSGRRRCRDGCSICWDPAVRRLVNAGRRWAKLDPAA